jgi:hypothetical protein
MKEIAEMTIRPLALILLTVSASALAQDRANKALQEAIVAGNAAARCEYAAAAGADEASADLDKADFAKARDECRLLKNTAARAEYVLGKIIERNKKPKPNPEDVPPPDEIRVGISGAAREAEALGTIATPTGNWPVADLGAVGSGRAYLFRHDKNPAWWSVCITRAPDGSGTIDEQRFDLTIEQKGATVNVPVTVLPGSMKCADSGEPVTPDMERLRAAVAARRVNPYSTSAFAGWPRNPGLALSRLPNDGDGTWRSDRIYGRASSSNALGIVDGQAGEAGSSRGFLAETDAAMIAAAVDGDEAAFVKAAARGRSDVLYGLSLPNMAIFSDNHHALRDPQLPLAGDRPYANEGNETNRDQYGNDGEWTAPGGYAHLAEIRATAGKKYRHGDRNEAHLFNHGYAYWLATGDPRAAILQQAVAAYAWAANYKRQSGVYLPRFVYQRATLNQFSAVWKARDVSLNASGPLLWERSRVEKMETDLWAGWTSMLAALDARTDAVGRMHSALFAYDETEFFSDFMGQAYGAEPAYLWASAGHPELLTRLAQGFVLRGRIGGTRGFDNPDGSSFIKVDGSLLTSDAIIEHINSTRAGQAADSFDGGQAHYILRAYWLLRMTDDAAARGWMPPVPGVPEAIAGMEVARGKTRSWKYLPTMSIKHGGQTFSKE